MLQGKIRSAIGLIEDVVDNKQKESDNANIARRNSIFFDSLAKIKPFVISYMLAKRNFSFDLQTADACLDELISYANTTFDNKKAVNPTLFKQRSEAFIEMTAKEWETFYKTGSSELINGLNIIVLVHPSPTVVRSCIAAFNRCEKWPLTQEKIDSYKEADQKAKELLKEMKFDDEIKEFLIKVRDKKATLSDITPSISEWIQSEKIADKVSLSIKNTV